ncbi:MAG: hypothetical protein Q4G09_00875 [Clostridia bacterium]|nr:hypothetical protein [Clostridia bacterium]
MKKKIIFSILLILVGIIILIINKVISNYDWHLRSDFIWLASFMIPVGIFLLGMFLLKTIKNNQLKCILTILWTVIISAVTLVELFLLCWIIKTTIIKEIDGVKYCGVEHVSNRLRKEINYYKDYNIFAYHETKEYIEEFYDYDNYKIPEFRKYHKIPRTDSIIYYYDENGNITDKKTYSENGALINIDTD